MALPINFEVVNTEAVNKKLGEVSKNLSDLRPAFALFKQDFYRYEQQLFRLKSPGKYQDLSPKYKERKVKKYGFAYPILKASGALSKSLLSPTSPGSVAVVKKDFFEIGTNVPYGVYHQSTKPRRKIPHRPFFIFRGPGAGTENPVPGASLSDRWIAIMDKYVERLLTGKTTMRTAP